jgi:hypothetical protein
MRQPIIAFFAAASLIALVVLRPGISRGEESRGTDDQLSNAFATGWMLVDTNDDGVVDSIDGKIVVPAKPSSAENAAAANWAGRLVYGSTGVTLPLVVTAAEASRGGPRVWIGRGAVPPGAQQELASMTSILEKGEGGIFVVGGNLAVVGGDDAGLMAAAASFSARSPYQWEVPGNKLSAISAAVATVVPGVKVELIGVTYQQGKQGIRRALFRASGNVAAAALGKALSSPQVSFVHELMVSGDAASVSAVSPRPMAAAIGNETADAESAAEAEDEEVQPIDLATLYTVNGLFEGSAKNPFPGSLKSHLYVSPGASGVAMANLSARIGLEGTGITLPLASSETDVTSMNGTNPVVIASNSPLGKVAEEQLKREESATDQGPSELSTAEGEVRIVDNVFKKSSAVLVRGDDAGSAGALNLLSGRFPNLWEPGKQYLSVEEIRHDLHSFLSLHSGVGQAAVALYHLDRWAKEVALASDTSSMHDVRADVYVDLADPGLGDFARKIVEKDMHVSNVQAGARSLHAGTQCCAVNPDLHYQSPTQPFHQSAPTFSEDLVIPWEGRRLLQMVSDAASRIKPGHPVTIVARVSEGPQERQKLTAQLLQILTDAGVVRSQTHVEVLSAYKQGYSWLMDEIAPELTGKAIGGVQIDFAKNVDPTGIHAMSSSSRWVQELYPVDEMLAQKLNLPLAKVTFSEFAAQPTDPTYRVHVADASGHEILSRSFRVTTVVQPYNKVMPEYEDVQVETGWVRLENGSDVLLNHRIKTDTEEFWEHYQSVTLPKIYQIIMAQNHGVIQAEYQPLFDTLRIDFHMSEPDYNIGLDQERISSIEALQEDTMWCTANFFDMMGHLEANQSIAYPGRILPIVHASEDGKDGRVRIEFYAKAAANPLVRLSWTDAQGKEHERERDLPALTGSAAVQPRLIGARIKDGASGVENLTWSLPADFLLDQYEDWTKVELQDRVEHNILSVEQAEGQLYWLEQMHLAGLYRDDLAYPHIERMAVRFELPFPLNGDVHSPPPSVYDSWAILPPATPRPMISDYAGKITGTSIVQWDEPIGPAENAGILARLANYPGVNAYWLGRSYLGQDTWAADLTLPSPSALRSWAKETTLKATIIYSARQHACEDSSTSHVDRLGELLVSDEKVHSLLKQVNVVLHPIDNTDGAQLSVDLFKITPDNQLMPGYHGSLAADVSQGQEQIDPVYPETRVRPLLIKSWLPDIFLDPHGYDSHENVLPFSGYTAWAVNRQSAAPNWGWWIPHGWFTSLEYLRGPDHPYGEQLAYAFRDRIVAAERNVPGLLPLEERENARYERYGRRWEPRRMVQPIFSGIRIEMALEAAPDDSEEVKLVEAAGVSTDITWYGGYTEAPDQTAHGDYLKLVASAGLAWDLVHLNYLAQGKLRIVRTEHSGPNGVEWRVQRKRPILPSSEPSTLQGPTE